MMECSAVCWSQKSSEWCFITTRHTFTHPLPTTVCFYVKVQAIKAVSHEHKSLGDSLEVISSSLYPNLSLCASNLIMHLCLDTLPQSSGGLFTTQPNKIYSFQKIPVTLCILKKNISQKILMCILDSPCFSCYYRNNSRFEQAI